MPTDAAPVYRLDDTLRLNQIQVLGTHNSYHVAPAPGPLLTPGLFAEYKGRIARCAITDALSSCQSAASRLRAAALCAGGLESAPLSQLSRASSGA